MEDPKADTSIYQFRPTCKALIIRDGKLLTILKKESDCIYNFLPGGGLNWGESSTDALKRECIEEIDIEEMDIGDLAFVRESFKPKKGIENNIYYHKIEMIFECKILSGAPKLGKQPDNGQIGIEWIDISDIEKSNLYPSELITHIKAYYLKKSGMNVYIGEVN